MSDDTSRKPFKDYFDAALVAGLAEVLSTHAPAFDAKAFVSMACAGLESLEMKDRVAQIAAAMHQALPGPVSENLRVLTRAMPSPLPTADGVTSSGFPLWPYSDYIASHGLADPDAAFDAMIALTQRFTAEFAIRPFLAADLRGTLARLASLVTHPSLHVRRWVSEGTRTRLPWAARVPGLAEALPERVALLDALRLDPELYVRRSVANHVGDILKDDINAGLALLRRWQADDRPESDWIVRHAARTQLKAGHPGALALFGLSPLEGAKATLRAEPKTVAIGDTVTLHATLTASSRAGTALRVDYALTSPGARGGQTRKVFRWSDSALPQEGTLSLETRHAFIPRSVRAVHPGTHAFTLIVNGVALATCEVEVTA